MPAQELETVLAYFEEAQGLFRQANDYWGLARILTVTGETLRLQGDYDRAGGLYRESLSLFRGLGNLWGIRMALSNMGFVALHEGNAESALTLLGEALIVAQEVEDRQGTATVLMGLAGVAGLMKESERAAVLFGVGEAMFESAGVQVAPGDRPDYGRSAAAVRAILGSQVFEDLRAKGRAMTPSQAVSFANELGKA
jgi:tetratricopeptide (TPR) repeat protein